MKMFKLIFFITVIFGCSYGVPALLSSSHIEQKEASLQLYAYRESVEDNFNEKCILCTESKDYKATIFFTKHWKVTLWRNQAYLGRTLITSQRHFSTYEEMTDEEAKEYKEILRLFLPALKKTFGTTHFNVAYLMNQAYKPENKEEPHFHWHIIPRYEGKRTFADEVFQDPDFGNSFDFQRKQYMDEEFQEKAIQAIRENLDITFLEKKNDLP